MEFPKRPKFGSKGRERSDAVALKIREEGFSPEPPMPHIMKKAPHQDAAELIDHVVGALQEAGGTICGMLDKPLDATIKIEGPHRIVDVALGVPTGLVRNFIQRFME